MKEAIECLEAWLEFYSSVQEIAPELWHRTDNLIARLKKSTAIRSAALIGRAGRKAIPIKDRRRIAKQKGTVASVAKANGVSEKSVRNFRKEFSINT